MKKRLLLVEDTQSLAENIADVFRMEDYEVVVARHGLEALGLLPRYSFDVIISDWLMPVMDGAALLGEIRKDARYCHLPVIILSAMNMEETNLRYLRNQGVDLILDKSVEIEILLHSVLQLVSKKNG